MKTTKQKRHKTIKTLKNATNLYTPKNSSTKFNHHGLTEVTLLETSSKYIIYPANTAEIIRI